MSVTFLILTSQKCLASIPLRRWFIIIRIYILFHILSTWWFHHAFVYLLSAVSFPSSIESFLINLLPDMSMHSMTHNRLSLTCFTQVFPNSISSLSYLTLLIFFLFIFKFFFFLVIFIIIFSIFFILSASHTLCFTLLFLLGLLRFLLNLIRFRLEVEDEVWEARDTFAC